MAPTPPPAPETEDTLKDAYMTLKSSQDGPGKKEQAFDKFGNAVASTGNSPTLASLSEFYDANRSVITSAAAGLSSMDEKAIDHVITGFPESVKVIMDGLTSLAQVHPIIGVAVVAFKLVVTLDLTRRENNRKVIAVKIQMQQMMCTLFQLRRVKDSDEVAPDGMILKDRLRSLMEQIAQDIKECGSACDVYLKKSFIAKTLKSKIYEGRLAGYAAKFMGYRDDLDKSLTIHTALGVDTANEKLDIQSSQLQSIDTKLDLLQKLFRKLDTTREKNVSNFIESNGGSKAVIERDDLVENLVTMSGETIENLADKSLNSRSNVDSVKEKLRRELAEDLDVALKRNFSLFESKMEIQNRNITEALNKHTEYLRAISSGTHDKIKDIDLQNMWKEMGWKGSVKARHFVLALRDYFVDRFTTGTPLPGVNNTTDHSDTVPSLPALVDDKWALQYINVAHLQNISEAIDDDGTGFVNVKEANTFAIERPKGWRLLHWIAFWAKGWETSLADYKAKIVPILQEMDDLRHKVLEENRYHVDIYLRRDSITGIEHVLRAMKTANQYNLCPELVSLTKAHTTAEEERLRTNLENICYDLDSAGTVTLITGPGRIERYLFPLLYLTLRRHLEVFYYACRNVVDNKEFFHMSITLESIFDVVDQRIESLSAVFKQVHVDVNSHFKNFALGMFYDLSVNRYSYGSCESLIMTWPDTSKTKNELDEAKIIDNPENAKPIFSFNPDSQNNYQSAWLNWPCHSFDADPYNGTMLGSWTGHFWSKKGDSILCAFGLTELKVEMDPEDKNILKGNAVVHSGELEMNGRRRRVERGGKEYEQFDLVMSYEDGFSLRLFGSLNEEDEELVGQWASFGEKGAARLAYDTHPFGDDPPTGEVVQDGEAELANDEDKEETSKERNGEDESEAHGEDEEQTGRSQQLKTTKKQTPDLESESALVQGREEVASFGTSNEGGAEPIKEDRAEIPGEGGTEVNGKTNVADGDAAMEADAEGDGDNDTRDVEVEGEVVVRNADEDEPIVQTCIFRRTPAEVEGFRYLLDKDEKKAKARWTFLRESVLYLIRRRLWSWSYLKAWNRDREIFLDLYKRDWLISTCDFRIPNPMTQAEKQEWHDMRSRLPPSTIRVCVEALRWSLGRLTFHYGVECDGCKFRLIGERFICLTCIDLEMSRSFDLCSECKDEPAKRDDFVHTADHTLVRARKYIHAYRFPWLITEARAMTTRLKKRFSELPRKGEQDGYSAEAYHLSTGDHSELLCGCCAKPAMVPCWVCITCGIPETYICWNCEEKEQPVLKNGTGNSTHHRDHHLLRLHNLKEADFEQQKVDPTVTRINKLEQRFESRILALENKVGAQLASFESLLRRIALQLKVPDHEEAIDSDNRLKEMNHESD